VRLDLRPRRDLAALERLERLLPADAARDADRLYPFAPVLLRGQVVETKRGMRTRIGARDLHRAARVGGHRAYMHLVAVLARGRGAVVADRERQEVEHEVRIRDLVIRAHEAACLEVVRRARAAAEEEPARADLRPPPLLQRRLH